MNWCFAKINGRLAELYFEKNKSAKPKILGHCYVNKSEYKTKTELRWIEQDSKHFNFLYKNSQYIDLGEKSTLPSPPPVKMKVEERLFRLT